MQNADLIDVDFPRLGVDEFPVPFDFD
jgi:hypothetical protein